MKLTVVTHYCKDDPEFDGDYSDIEILNVIGDLIVEYGDSYHDKGDEKVEGFIAGIDYIRVEFQGLDPAEVNYKRVADREDY